MKLGLSKIIYIYDNQLQGIYSQKFQFFSRNFHQPFHFLIDNKEKYHVSLFILCKVCKVLYFFIINYSII